MTAALLGPVAPLEAKSRKGDRYLAEGRIHEGKKEWDAALEQYEQALSEDPAEIVYQMAVQKARFQASQFHVDQGLKVRTEGRLGDALVEFQKAFAIDPGSIVSGQEIVRTQEMIQRERKRVEETGKEAPPEVRALTPVEEMKKKEEDRMKRMLPVPELKPTGTLPNMKISGQPVRVLYETVGKVGGITVLWDPDYQAPSKNQFNIDFPEGTTVEEALNYLEVVTNTYWKPLSPTAIFITNNNPNKRRDFAEMVAQTFYIQNVSLPQEIQEIVNAVRSVTELQRVVAYNTGKAIIVRGEADQVALAGKMIHDLDKARAEVVVDIMVIEASSTFSRQITAAIASTGLNMPISFTPRPSIQVQGTTSTTTTGTTTGTTGTGTTVGSVGSTPVTVPGTTTNGTVSGAAIPLNQLAHISTADFSTVLPGALLQAALSDAKTRVLQAPQLRAVENTKASLKIGQKQPTATGSFQPGIGGVGINPLVNTQFNFIDVGVNVEINPQVHENGEISMHVDVDISNIAGQVNLGGINQPIIGQRHIVHDVRLHEGEVNLLAGLTQSQDDKTVTGIPGLSSIPLIRRLFTGESVDHNRDELMIALIPHVIRKTDVTPENLAPIAVGNATTIKLNYAPAKPEEAAPAKPAAGQPPAAAAATPGATPPVTAPSATTPAATTPPATAPPATAPPATAPPATAPPATAPPATAPPATTTPAAGAQAKPELTARVRFQPAQADTSSGATITASLAIDGATDVASAPMQIQFDPKILQITGVSRGDFLSQDGQQPLFTRDYRNDSGTASIQLSRMPGSPGISGSGVLVTLNFQAVGKGATAVTIRNLSLANSQGQSIAAGTAQLAVNVK